jgi:lysozyme family protein
MKANFGKALKAVLVHEGGYVNHPKDPGGATNLGITQKVYDAWRVGRNLQPRSVKQIDKAETEAIYRKQYWDAIQGDELPAGVDYVVFDYAVNSGPSRAVKGLQKALKGYTGPIDGVLGVRTLRRVKEDDNNDALIDRICDGRMAFLKQLNTWSVFGAGWSKRVKGVRAMGQAMATGKDIPKALLQSASGQERAPDADVAAAPTKAPADAVTGAGLTVATTGGGGLGFLNEATEKIQPLADYSTTIATILVGFIVTGVAITIGGLAWRGFAVWRSRRRAEAID